MAQSFLSYIPSAADEAALWHFKLFNTFQLFCALAGCGAVFYFAIRVIDIVCDLWFRNPIPAESFGADKGYWAVVTGCTDGIGKELALQLGDKGYNLVLLSRTQSKLDDVRDQLLAKKVKVDSYAVDFSCTTNEQWDYIEQMVKSKNIGILVNNVGVCHPAAVTFVDESPAMCKQMVDVNIVTMMKMTRFVVPQMRQRKNGCILNIGSWTCLKGMPFLSVYAGTKGFVKTFSQSLAYELKSEGITIQHILSFWVASKMSGYKTVSVSIPSAREYVKSVLGRIGLMCGTLECFSTVPYGPHSYLAFVSTTMWDARIVPPILYSIANNLYKLAEKKRLRIKKQKELAL